MKKLHLKIYALGAILVLFGAMVLTTGCEGPQGPQGEPGVAGNGTCTECHNVSTFVKARIVQYDKSVHATGGNFERATTACAPCHTHEGFRERIESGEQVTMKDVLNPTPPGCRTCHHVHETYEYSDFALTTTDPVELWINGETVDIGKGNLCVNCHQPRPVSPAAVPGGEDVKITSSRWGPHHGPQSAILVGTAGYEVAGSTPYESSLHKTAVTDGCVGCHMQPPFGNQAGGHNMQMAYEFHGSETQLAAVCANCHEGADSFDVNGVQTEVDELLETLKAKLIEKGIYNESTELANTGTYPVDVAGAYLNFLLVEEDRSHGVHNPKYVMALLKNSIESLQ